LERALELDEIYGSQKVEINLVQQRYKRADGETVCFGCGGRGHYKNNCPIAANKSQNYNKYKLASTSTQGAQSSKATNGMANLVKIRAVRMSEQMTGYCNVDGKICKFLADTGAQRTVIDVSVLNDMNNINECLFRVQLADKSEAAVLGVKKCSITLGYHTVQVEAIITKNVSHNCLLGLDFLNKCPTTKVHLDGLQVM
jgi:predicted aspartyl protease